MKEEIIDYRKFLHLVMRKWYLFAISLPLMLGAAHYHLKRTSPTYQSMALLLIKDDKNSGQLNEEFMFKELGLTGPNKNLENERAILSYTPLMYEVVKNLELQYQYFEKDFFRETDLYQNSPIKIANWQPNPGGWEWLYGDVYVDNEGGYRLVVPFGEGEELEVKGEFGKALTFPYGKLTLTYNGKYETDKPLGIKAIPAWYRAKELLEGLAVSIYVEEASILMLTMEDVSPQRARDVLDELIRVYNENTIEIENQVFQNSIALINERIGLIVQELTEAEKDVQDYKQRFSMVELSAEGSLLMNELAGYERDISETEVQLTVLESIEDYLLDNRENFEFVPTNMTLNNLTLTSQLESFNTLLTLKQQKSSELGPAHPELQLIEKQIRNLRQTIIENIRSMKDDLLVTRNANSNLKNNLEARLQSLPRRERELVEIERRKSVKENLYLYLLQKREESAISMAITMAKGSMVEPPEAPLEPIKPNPILIYLTAAFLGLAIPFGLLVLRVLLNDKIITEEDLEGMTPLPVAGILAHSPGKKNKELVIRENSRSVSAEMFRMLRANLNFIIPDKNQNVMMVTSCISGEGKSFISLNFGMVQALAGKKAVLMYADLHKPKDKSKWKENGATPQLGVVNYIVDSDTTIDQVVHNSGFHPNFDIVPSGPKPPNPGELILSPRFGELIEELRQRYDFVIIDMPPVGIVADALQIRDHVDASLLVIRSGYTTKGHLNLINNLAEHNKLPRPFIVLNAVQRKDYHYGSYGKFGYGYVKSGDYFEKEA